MGHVVIGEKYIGYTARDEIVRVEAYGKDRIRVRSTRNGSFSEESWTLLPPLSDECTVTGKRGKRRPHQRLSFGGGCKDVGNIPHYLL